MGNTDISPGAIAPKEEKVRKAKAISSPLLVSDLGWSAEEAKETRARLAALEEDWEAPGMEAYDRL
jgi:hypothetical protein